MKTVATLATTAALVLTALPAALEAAPGAGVAVDHAEPLGNLEIRFSDDPQRDPIRDLGPADMSFDALGRRFEMTLEPNTALLGAAARATIRDRIAVYRGRLNDVPSSWVRIVISEGVPSGMIYDGTELYAIEAPSDSVHGNSGSAIFRLADLRIAPGAMSCGTEMQTASSGAELYDNIVSGLQMELQRGPGAAEEIEVGAVGDAEFARNRVDPRQSILTRLNNVDGIYSSELGIQITVPNEALEVLDDSNDPFSDSDPDPTDNESFASVLLNELADYRAASALQRERGLTHLFTGRDLPGSTVGIAFLNVLCRPNFGAGLTQAGNGSATDSLVAAHEIGHNFGANHDGDPSGSCPNVASGQFIMAEVTNGNPEFSQCSKDVMLANAALAACIVPLPTVDVRVTSFDEPESILLGNALTLNFNVENRGSISAANVSVDVTLPDNVTLVSAVTPTANCSSGAGTATCDIGMLGGSSGTAVTLVASTDAVGPASFTATVTADADEQPGNNSDTHVVSVNPAINLIANTSAPLSVTLNQWVTATVTIENSSILDATAVTASVTVDAGLRAEGATWTAGDCTVNGATIDCSADTVAAQSMSTLSLEITGVQAGSRGYTVSLDANEDDADEANNVVSGTISVVSATSNRDDGGGGAIGLLWLLALALPATRRYRARLGGIAEDGNRASPGSPVVR